MTDFLHPVSCFRCLPGAQASSGSGSRQNLVFCILASSCTTCTEPAGGMIFLFYRREWMELHTCQDVWLPVVPAHAGCAHAAACPVASFPPVLLPVPAVCAAACRTAFRSSPLSSSRLAPQLRCSRFPHPGAACVTDRAALHRLARRICRPRPIVPRQVVACQAGRLGGERHPNRPSPDRRCA